jgi:hypothetical protein
MKWSWRSFFIQLIGLFLATPAVSLIIGKVIVPEDGTSSSEPNRLAIGVDGFPTPMLFALPSGWKRWNLKPMIAVTFIVSSFHAGGNIVIGLAAIAQGSFFYFFAQKLHAPFNYRSVPRSGPRDEPDAH